MRVVVFAEQRNGHIKASAHEALALALKVAGSSADVAAVVVGDSGINTESLSGWGADTIFMVADQSLRHYNPLSYAAAVEAVVREFKPEIFLAVATPMARDLLPRLAVRCDGALITDAVEWNGVEAGVVRVTKPVYAGKCLATVEASGPLKMVSIRPNVFPALRPGTGAGKAVNVTMPTVNQAASIVTRDVRKGQSDKPDLTEANVIISGGRALGNADNFKVLHDFADVIGATVGASRAAVDAGYAPHDMQVGQTGKTVNPNLYIACGISGSIQHLAGMRTSKVIVAVNTDSEAPIFAVADYGIVGDLFQVVPALAKAAKEIL